MSKYKVVIDNLSEGVMQCRLLKDDVLQDSWLGVDKKALLPNAEAALRQFLILERAEVREGGKAVLVFEDNSKIPAISPFVNPVDVPIVTRYAVKREDTTIETVETTSETIVLQALDDAQTNIGDPSLRFELEYPPAEPPP